MIPRIRSARVDSSTQASYSSESTQQQTSRILVVGLGNPGPQYLFTRHNAGFLLADCLHQYYQFSAWQQKFQGEISKASISPIAEVFLLKPLIFMNCSGRAVQEAAHFFKIPPSHVFVLHDDIDLPFGAIKVKQGGGTAGHNGLKSIENSLSTNEFWRLRIGVGRSTHNESPSQHVLSNFSKAEQTDLIDLYDKICCFFSLFLDNKANEFTQKVSTP